MLHPAIWFSVTMGDVEEGKEEKLLLPAYLTSTGDGYVKYLVLCICYYCPLASSDPPDLSRE